MAERIYRISNGLKTIMLGSENMNVVRHISNCRNLKSSEGKKMHNVTILARIRCTWGHKNSMNKVPRERRNYSGLMLRSVSGKVTVERTLQLNLEIPQDSTSYKRKRSLHSKQEK